MSKLDERTELGVQILEALKAANLSHVEEIINTGIRSLDEITEVESWNWLHKTLLTANENEPPPKSIQYLIDNGNDVNAQDNYGMTPLHYAMQARNIDAVRVLLEAGANANFKNEKIGYPMWMVFREIPQAPDMESLKLLLKYGSDLDPYEENIQGNSLYSSLEFYLVTMNRQGKKTRHQHIQDMLDYIDENYPREEQA